jgi:uncharacterized protein DUF6929
MKIKLLDHKHIPGFNSGVGLEFHSENIYITDHEAREVLVLSQHWKELERIPLFDTTSGEGLQHRDLNAATIIQVNSIPRLLALRTEVAEIKHHKAVLLNLDDRTREDHTIDEFDERLKVFGIEEINIGSAAIILGKLILGNRRGAGGADNNFIVTDIELWRKQETEEIGLLSIKYPDDTPPNLLLSGMCFSPENDWLLLTFTSDTSAGEANEPSEPGSYFGLVENVSRKVTRQKVKINELIPLNEVSSQLDGREIKSLCLQTDKYGKVKLYLAADSAEGGTDIFRIRVKH